jgi:hypothetical protein
MSIYILTEYEQGDRDEGVTSAAGEAASDEERSIRNVFLWIGQQCVCGSSATRKQAEQAWALTVDMLSSEQQNATKATVWRVIEGEEPESFKSLFPGGISVHSGEDPWHTISEKHALTAMKANITQSLVHSKCADVGAGKLYRVVGTRTRTTVLVQCIPSAKYLNSSECFVAEDGNGSVLYIWQGGGASEKDIMLARQAPNILDKKVLDCRIGLSKLLLNC